MIRGIGFNALMKAVYLRLTTHALTSGYTFINRVPRPMESLTFPYVSFGTPSYARADGYSARDQEAEDIAVNLHVWSKKNTDDECSDMMDDIARALDSSALNVTGYENIYAHLDYADIMVDDTEPAVPVRHGIVRFRFYIVPTS